MCPPDISLYYLRRGPLGTRRENVWTAKRGGVNHQHTSILPNTYTPKHTHTDREN